MSFHSDLEDENFEEEPSVKSSEDLLEAGRHLQYKQAIPLLAMRRPRMWPWVVLAILLVLTSLSIEIFWPIPQKHGPLPQCQGERTTALSSCQERISSGQNGISR